MRSLRPPYRMVETLEREKLVTNPRYAQTSFSDGNQCARVGRNYYPFSLKMGSNGACFLRVRPLEDIGNAQNADS